jgi:hypothetical protein
MTRPPSSTTLKIRFTCQRAPSPSRSLVPFRAPLENGVPGRAPVSNLASGQAFSFAAARLAVALKAIKNPTELVAKGGLGGVLIKDLMRGLNHHRTFRAKASRLLSWRNSSTPRRYCACSNAAGRRFAGIADMTMPSAIAAFARAVLGIDVAIVHMTEPVNLDK